MSSNTERIDLERTYGVIVVRGESNRLQACLVSEIAFVRAAGAHTEVHLTSGEMVLVRERLHVWEERLPRFFAALIVNFSICITSANMFLINSQMAEDDSSSPHLSGLVSKDGRHLRSERSRAAIVNAALAFIRETGRVPSSKQLANLVGLAQRTIFNLFGDKRQLMLAVVQAFRREEIDRLPAVPAVGDFEQRVERFVDELAPFLDDYARVRWAVLTAAEAIPDVERGVVLNALRDRVAELLASAGIDLDEHASVRAAVYAAVDPMTWLLYRTHQRLSVADSRRAMTRALVALARDGAPPSPDAANRKTVPGGSDVPT